MLFEDKSIRVVLGLHLGHRSGLDQLCKPPSQRDQLLLNLRDQRGGRGPITLPIIRERLGIDPAIFGPLALGLGASAHLSWVDDRERKLDFVQALDQSLVISPMASQTT